MSAEQATVAQRDLPFQTVEDLGLPLQIKTEEEDDEEESRGVKGPCVIQAGRLRDILGWAGPEQEPGESGPQGWEEQSQEHPVLLQSLPLRWGTPQETGGLRTRHRGIRRREQQGPVLFEEMDVNSMESEPVLAGRRRHLHREAKQRLERSLGRTPSITPIPSFTKTSRRGTNWSYGEVLDLLDIWGEQRIQQVLQSSHRNMDTFQVIANEMAKRGHERTAQECRTKTKTLRRDYKKVKESHMAGRGQSACPFYDQLERILESAGGIQKDESGGNEDAPLRGPKENGPQDGSRGSGETRDLFNLSVNSGDPTAMACKLENAVDEPRGTPLPTVEADLLPNPLLLAPQSTPGSPTTTTGSTAEAHVTPSQSPLPGPTGLSAAERLANLRNRHKKTRTDLAVELARAADRRMQEATDRILSALDDYAKADLEDREKDRLSTEQIIAIMQRQTELLEVLVRQQTSAPVAVLQASSRHGWPPRTGPSNHRLTAISSSRLTVSRRPLAPRVRNRRRPQNYSP
uniref:Myb/SANT-like DNA-binding domain-containing protein n=1 Tax=Pogona vitticeps TaxID=103695 RepID=A0ABM5FGF5_9SAUR